MSNVTSSNAVAALSTGSKYSAAATYFTPFMIVLGFVTNPIIIIVLWRGNITTSPTARIYYLWIAFFDLLTIASKDVGFTFLNMGLRYAFQDNPPWYLFAPSYAVTTCKAIAYTYAVAEMVANFTIMALAAERVLVLNFPFKAKKYIGKKKASVCLSVLLVVCVITCIVAWLTSDLIVNPYFSRLPTCGTYSQEYPWAQALTIALSLTIYFVSIFGATVFTIAAAVKMRSILAASKHLSRKAESSQDSKEIRSTVVMILIVIVNDLLFIPVCVLYITIIMLQMLASYRVVLIGQVTSVYTQFYPFVIIPHAVQFFIYYNKVPRFKEAVFALFRIS